MKWTSDEKKYLIVNYANTPREQIVKKLNRSWIAIMQYATQSLGLERVILETPKRINKIDAKHETLVGQQFDLLKVVKFSGYKEVKNGTRPLETIRIWECLCKCGSDKIILIQENNLKYGKSNSCGCKRIEHLRKIHEKSINPNAAFEYVFKTYKRSAERNKREFDLSEDDVRRITSCNCFYCNLPPSNLKDGYQGIKYKNSFYLWNGIDRIDSTKGYNIDNCVACCSVCNIAKRNMPLNDFINWVKRISNHFVEKGFIK